MLLVHGLLRRGVIHERSLRTEHGVSNCRGGMRAFFVCSGGFTDLRDDDLFRYKAMFVYSSWHALQLINQPCK